MGSPDKSKASEPESKLVSFSLLDKHEPEGVD